MFVTLDIDWAPDFVIREVDEMLTQIGIPVTWFITHRSDAVTSLFERNGYEIGVHPNFVPLLSDSPSRRSVDHVVEEVRSLAPKATAYRCHALVQSSQIIDRMRREQFTFDCNIFLPFTPIEALAPWRHAEGLVRVPYCWEDDTWIGGACRSPQEVVKSRGMRVIDLHPIHLWLNSDTLDRYERIKSDLNNEDLLRSSRNNDFSSGIMTAFRQMIEGVVSEGSET